MAQSRIADYLIKQAEEGDLGIVLEELLSENVEVEKWGEQVLDATIRHFQYPENGYIVQ